MKVTNFKALFLHWLSKFRFKTKFWVCLSSPIFWSASFLNFYVVRHSGKAVWICSCLTTALDEMIRNLAGEESQSPLCGSLHKIRRSLATAGGGGASLAPALVTASVSQQGLIN
jgi:hypothetical protein